MIQVKYNLNVRIVFQTVITDLMSVWPCIVVDMKRVKSTRSYTMVYWTLWIAQHVSGITMPIIRSSRLYIPLTGRSKDLQPCTRPATCHNHGYVHLVLIIVFAYLITYTRSNHTFTITPPQTAKTKPSHHPHDITKTPQAPNIKAPYTW